MKCGFLEKIVTRFSVMLCSPGSVLCASSWRTYLRQVIIIMLVIFYRSIFCPILLSQVNGCDEMLQAEVLQHKF
jgi:hypothetical protein